LDVAFPAPNTTITVVDPVTSLSVGVGSWVSIYKVVGANQIWVEGGQTDFTGKAYFNLDLTDTTTTYVVEVNPPWNKSNTLSSNKHTIVGADAIDGKSLALKTPNLFLSVSRSDGQAAARWSWIGLEKVDSTTFQFSSWENGASTNQGGRGALSLDVSSTYKLTIYPGFASAGARTTCYLSTNSVGQATAIQGKCDAGTFSGSDLSIVLSLGNVTGTITDAISTTGVAGVIVFAKNSETGEVLQTVSAEGGKYGLQLEPGNWKISYYSAGTTTEGFELVSQVESVTITNGSYNFADGEVRDIELARK